MINVFHGKWVWFVGIEEMVLTILKCTASRQYLPFISLFATHILIYYVTTLFSITSASCFAWECFYFNLESILKRGNWINFLFPFWSGVVPLHDTQSRYSRSNDQWFMHKYNALFLISWKTCIPLCSFCGRFFLIVFKILSHTSSSALCFDDWWMSFFVHFYFQL